MLITARGNVRGNHHLFEAGRRSAWLRLGLSRQGSVLVEGVLTLWMGLLLVGLFLETARRGLFEVRLQWEVFVLARETVLKGSKEAIPRSQKRLQSLFATLRIEHAVPKVQWFVDRMRADVFVRFPTFYRFPIYEPNPALGGRLPSKHHFEISRRCTFFFQ